MKIVSKFHVYIFYTFQEIRRQRELMPGRFIVLNDLSSPKMVIKIYFNFFKVLELSEYRRGYPYITANRNLVRLIIGTWCS